MQKAFNQARAYAGMLVSRPPFLITCDIGSHFEVWEGFSGEYGSYGARRRLNLKDLAQAEEFDRFVKIFTDPQVLNPEKLRARVTHEVAAVAKLSRWMEDQGHKPQKTASFLIRCISTMFWEAYFWFLCTYTNIVVPSMWLSQTSLLKPLKVTKTRFL